MADRYFSATAMGGRLYVQGISDRGLWDPAQLVYYSEEMVERMTQSLAGDRKVRTAEELSEAIRVSERGLPTIKLWISEELEDTARRVWQERGPTPRSAIKRSSEEQEVL